MKKLVLILVSATLLSSCANIAKGVVTPNQCKKCEVFNTQTGEVLGTYEGCGSENVRLEEKAKVAAFEIMKGGNCTIDVRCETYKKPTIE